MKDELRINIYKCREGNKPGTVKGYLGIMGRELYTNGYEIVLSNTLEGLPAAVESEERYIVSQKELEELIDGSISAPLGRLVYRACSECVVS